VNFIWILVAFLFGFIAKQIGLPPLVGYLSAGFILHAFGVEPAANLDDFADLGITLMLFTIGLKVNIKDLLRIPIWGSTISYMSIWTLLLIGGLMFVASISTLSYLDFSLEQSAIIAFALSFSSTVCVFKVIEDSSELKTRHSDLSISVLILQDIAAVVFLAFAIGKSPSMWAIALVALVFVRPLLSRLFNSSGHGELIPLLGFLLALGGAELFEWVDLKGDLGALLVGMLAAGLPKSNEMYKSLMSFKDLFLIGFFLSIGFTALPTFEMWYVACVLLVLLPIKFLLFYMVFSVSSFRARTSFLSSLLLSNYSEFGLIVISLSVAQSWLPQQILVIVALAISMSFVINTLLYKYAHTIFGSHRPFITRFQREAVSRLYVFEQPIGAEVIIVGMGRVGCGAYDDLEPELGTKVWGVDADQERASKFKEKGKNVVFGDADDIEFWEHIYLKDVKLIMLAIPSAKEMKNILYQLQHTEYAGRIAAIARYEDERKELIELGADVVFNYYAEVGAGFAEESRHLIHL
jgi:glutathione-regulated potassium-efflux system ancillary protein KefC